VFYAASEGHEIRHGQSIFSKVAKGIAFFESEVLDYANDSICFFLFAQKIGSVR